MGGTAALAAPLPPLPKIPPNNPAPRTVRREGPSPSLTLASDVLRARYVWGAAACVARNWFAGDWKAVALLMLMTHVVVITAATNRDATVALAAAGVVMLEGKDKMCQMARCDGRPDVADEQGPTDQQARCEPRGVADVPRPTYASYVRT